MPFSDNLYSIVDDESDTELTGRVDHQIQPMADGPRDQPTTWSEADDEVLSPTDGYFHAGSTSGSSATPALPASSNVPSVPNVWVRDPTLEPGNTAESKAQEARREAMAGDAALSSSEARHPTPLASVYDDAAYTYPSSHQRSGSTFSRAAPSTAAYAPSTTASYTTYAPQQRAYDHHSPLYFGESPPAYTPSTNTSTASPTAAQSRTSFSTNYNTFLQPSMGREETQPLMGSNPQSMDGPNDEFAHGVTTWRERVRRRLPSFDWRSRKAILLCLLLLAITFGLFVSTSSSGGNKVRGLSLLVYNVNPGEWWPCLSPS